MNNLRKSMIEELMLTLKIPQGNFNFGTIDDEIKHIQNQDLREFYKAVISADTFGNGMKAIIQTAEQFKPIFVDKDKEQIEKLIGLVHSLHHSVETEAQANGKTFTETISMLKFTYRNDDGANVTERAIEVLDLVKPYYGHKKLIECINHYSDGTSEKRAFREALEFSRKDKSELLASPVSKLILPKKAYYDNAPRENPNDV